MDQAADRAEQADADSPEGSPASAKTEPAPASPRPGSPTAEPGSEEEDGDWLVTHPRRKAKTSAAGPEEGPGPKAGDDFAKVEAASVSSAGTAGAEAGAPAC